MKSLQSIDNDIAILQALRKQMIIDASAESKAALAATARGFDWRVTSDGIGKYHVACRFDSTTVAAFKAWREAYPTSSESIRAVGSDDLGKWHGMAYIIARSSDGVPFIVASGGGSVVLTLDTGWHGATELTEDQFTSFMAGNVPVELRKPW